MVFHFSIRLASLPLAVSTLLVLNAHATITGVDEASDICPPTSDPCVVSERFEFVTGSILDFGLRKLEVRRGLLDVGAANITVLCGDFSTSSGEAPAIVLGNPDPFGDTPRLRLEARRACSEAPSVPCLRDIDCAAGTCSVGNGTIDLGGRIGSAGQKPGRIRMISAGDFTVRAAATANARRGCRRRRAGLRIDTRLALDRRTHVGPVRGARIGW